MFDVERPKPTEILYGRGTFQGQGINLCMGDEGARGELVNDIGVVFPCEVVEVLNRQNVRFRPPELLEPGDYKFVVFSRGGDPAGELQSSFRRVKYIQVVTPFTVDKIGSEGKDGEIVKGSAFAATGTNLRFDAEGGDSIKVLRLLEGFDSYGLTPDMIFKARTPRAIATLCEVGSIQKICHSDAVPEFCPLSDSQLGIYLDSISDSDSVKYNIPVLCRLPMHTDIERFKSAVCTVARNHKALSVAIAEQSGVPGIRYTSGEIIVTETDADDIDVVYSCTPRELHGAINVYGLNAGKHVLQEVPGVFTIDEAWATVEAAEKNRRHCYMLENCCYGEYEMLALMLVRSGVLGELVQCDGSYIHDQRHLQFDGDDDGICWRLKDMMEKYGNFYPTHGLGPLCKCLGINRGDRFDHLVSMSSATPSFEGYAREKKKGTSLENLRFNRGDVNFTLIRTAKGRVISLQHNVSTPRPYDRVNQLVGTKGVFRGFKDTEYRVCFEQELGDDGAKKYFDAAKAEEIRIKYMHPLWKEAGEFARKVGGHGGMDFMMDLRWAYCLQNGLPLDQDVYDLAAWCSICELSERSVRNRSASVDVPDFTRGAWKTAKPLGDLDIDLSKLEFKNVRRDKAALNA